MKVLLCDNKKSKPQIDLGHTLKVSNGEVMIIKFKCQIDLGHSAKR